jgi:hypothetical protein
MRAFLTWQSTVWLMQPSHACSNKPLWQPCYPALHIHLLLIIWNTFRSYSCLIGGKTQWLISQLGMWSTTRNLWTKVLLMLKFQARLKLSDSNHPSGVYRAPGWLGLPACTWYGAVMKICAWPPSRTVCAKNVSTHYQDVTQRQFKVLCVSLAKLLTSMLPEFAILSFISKLCWRSRWPVLELEGRSGLLEMDHFVLSSSFDKGDGQGGWGCCILCILTLPFALSFSSRALVVPLWPPAHYSSPMSFLLLVARENQVGR